MLAMEHFQDPAAIRELIENAAMDAIIRARNNYEGFQQQPPQFPEGFFDGTAAEAAANAVEGAFMGIIPFLKKVFKIIFQGILILCSSIVLYTLFYWIVMPGPHASETIYFDYSGIAKHPAISLMAAAAAEESSTTKSKTKTDPSSNTCTNAVPVASPSTSNMVMMMEPSPMGLSAYRPPSSFVPDTNADTGSDDGSSSSSSSQSSTANDSTSTSSSSSSTLSLLSIPKNVPWAVVDLFSRHSSQWEHYQHVDILPKPITTKRILSRRSLYYIEIFLELPESTINMDSGMFAVVVDLQAHDGTMLATSVRTARLPHETYWITTIRKMIWLLPILLGAVEESRIIVIPSFRHYVESTEKPLRFVTVKLVRSVSPNMQIEQPIEVIRGEVRIGRELNPLQLLLKEWFYSCAIGGILWLFVSQVGGLVLLRFVLDLRRKQQEERQRRQMMQDDASLNLQLDGSLADENNNNNISNIVPQEEGEWEDLPQPIHATTTATTTTTTTTTGNQTQPQQPQEQQQQEQQSSNPTNNNQENNNNNNNTNETITPDAPGDTGPVTVRPDQEQQQQQQQPQEQQQEQQQQQQQQQPQQQSEEKEADPDSEPTFAPPTPHLTNEEGN